MFLWRESDAGLDRAVTDRHDGHSVAPYDTLNLGGGVGDRGDAVRANRAALATAFGLPAHRLVFMQQCHGAEVVVVEEPTPTPLRCDAVVTTSTTLALAVLVADCVPILLADRSAGVVAAVHAGRAGVAAGIVPQTLIRLAELGAGQVEALVGPSICAACYEVPQHLCDEVAALVPATRARTRQGTPALDLAAGVLAQLGAAGVRTRQVPGCTRELGDLYSHRRGAPTGRFAAVIRRHDSGPRGSAGAGDEGW